MNFTDEEIKAALKSMLPSMTFEMVDDREYGVIESKTFKEELVAFKARKGW